MQFATRLKRWREKKGLTQSEFAERLNVAQSTVGCWEAGSRRPSLDIFEELCQALGITPAEFYMNESESAAVRAAMMILAAAKTGTVLTSDAEDNVKHIVANNGESFSLAPIPVNHFAPTFDQNLAGSRVPRTLVAAR